MLKEYFSVGEQQHNELTYLQEGFFSLCKIHSLSMLLQNFIAFFPGTRRKCRIPVIQIKIVFTRANLCLFIFCGLAPVVSAVVYANVPNCLFVWICIHYNLFLFFKLPLLSQMSHNDHMAAFTPFLCQREVENWNHKWHRPNSVGQPCKRHSHHWHLLMCLASLM